MNRIMTLLVTLSVTSFWFVSRIPYFVSRNLYRPTKYGERFMYTGITKALDSLMAAVLWFLVATARVKW